MDAQLLSTEGSSPRAAGGHKVAVALSAAVGLLAGAFVAVSLSAPATAEPIDLAALATPSSMALQRPALFQRSLQSNQLRGSMRSGALSPAELKELRAEENVLQKVAQKIASAAGVAGLMAHPIVAHAAKTGPGGAGAVSPDGAVLETGLTNGDVALAFAVLLIPMIAADRLGRALKAYN